MSVLIFETKAKADTLLKEISVSPFGMVWMWFNPDLETNDIQYAMDATGRCAISHNFSEEDMAWLEIYLEGIVGVQILDALPSDWQYPID